MKPTTARSGEALKGARRLATALTAAGMIDRDRLSPLPDSRRAAPVRQPREPRTRAEGRRRWRRTAQSVQDAGDGIAGDERARHASASTIGYSKMPVKRCGATSVLKTPPSMPPTDIHT